VTILLVDPEAGLMSDLVDVSSSIRCFGSQMARQFPNLAVNTKQRRAALVKKKRSGTGHRRRIVFCQAESTRGSR